MAPASDDGRGPRPFAAATIGPGKHVGLAELFRRSLRRYRAALAAVPRKPGTEKPRRDSANPRRSQDRDVWAPPPEPHRRSAAAAPSWARPGGGGDDRGRDDRPSRDDRAARDANRRSVARQPARKPRPPPARRDAPVADGDESKYSDWARQNGLPDVDLIEGIERDIVETAVTTTWADVADLDEAKQLLQEAVARGRAGLFSYVRVAASPRLLVSAEYHGCGAVVYLPGSGCPWMLV